jgi:hypothetical protein
MDKILETYIEKVDKSTLQLLQGSVVCVMIYRDGVCALCNIKDIKGKIFTDNLIKQLSEDWNKDNLAMIIKRGIDNFSIQFIQKSWLITRINNRP